MPVMVFDEDDVGLDKLDPQRTMPAMVFDEEVGHNKSDQQRKGVHEGGTEDPVVEKVFMKAARKSRLSRRCL